MKKKYFIILLSVILCSGFVLAYKKSQKINPITKNIINSKYNNDKNDYFIIREPDSIFFTKNGQEHILKDYNVLVFENREENENNGIEMFMNKLKDKLKKDKNIDILYSRPQKTKDITFHWNVFSIYYAKQENNSIYLILNDNDKKTEEMQTLLKELIKNYPNMKVIYLPKIQYSHKGCSVKAAMFVKELHPANAPTLIFVTLSGIVTLARAVHPENTYPSMLVTPSGIAILVNALHPENAESPMLITLSGIVTLVKFVRLLNKKAPILDTPSGMTTLSGHIPFTLYKTLPKMTNPSGWLSLNGVPSNARSLMLVTLSGITISVNKLHP